MNLEILNQIKVSDLSSRLPGPMGSYILATQGASVTKLENSDYGGDNFASDQTKSTDPHFYDWYQRLNKNKKILNISFQKEQEKLLNTLNESQIIICPLAPWANELIQNINSQKPQAIIKIAGSNGKYKALHDLNALGKTKTFQHQLKHSKSLPYLPFAGIAFGQYLATTALSVYIKALENQKPQTQVLYLDEVTELVLDSLNSKKSHSDGRFLHTGAYPCYEIYSSKDDYALCLAAIEEKYWLNILNCLELPLTSEDRFDTTGKIKKVLQDKFLELTAAEIESAIANVETCLTVAK